MTYRRRTYPEVLDNMLTTLTRGVSAEPHPFPPKEKDPYQHHLAKTPVDRIVSVYGSRGGKPHLFQPEHDYKQVDNSIQWQEGADLPDAGTLVQVTYYPISATPVITDIQTGSVARTLVETAALEIARLHAQLDVVYQAGFLETATGSSLDKVVDLLGIERVPPGRPIGDVVFSRAAGSAGNITIPLGTRIITADGEVEYETSESVTMLDAQSSVRIPARDLEPGEGLPADSLNVLPVPIFGVARVTNPEPTTLANRGEDDHQLRKRARRFLHGSERATLGALEAVLARQGIKAEIAEFTEKPGLIRVTPHAESLSPEQHQRLLQALDDTAPAGIQVELAGALVPEKIHLSLLLTTGQGLTESQLLAVQQEVRVVVADQLEALEVDQDAGINRLVGALLAIDRLNDVRLLSAREGNDADLIDLNAGVLKLAGKPNRLGNLSLVDPNLPTRVQVRIPFGDQEIPPNETEVTSALEPLFRAFENPPTGNREASYAALVAALPLVDIDQNVNPVSLTLIQPGGLTQRLSQVGDSYQLTDYERLVVGEINIEEVTS